MHSEFDTFGKEQETLNDSWQQREEAFARQFAKKKARLFSAQTPFLETCKEQITADDTRLFILRGTTGSGKSTLLAKLQEDFSKENEIFFFAGGINSRSQTVRELLYQMVYKLEILLLLPQPFEETHKTSSVCKWAERLEQLSIQYAAKTERTLLFFCDGIEQLAEEDSLKSFSWLPASLPSSVKMILSLSEDIPLPQQMPLQSLCKTQNLPPLAWMELPAFVQTRAKDQDKEIPLSVLGALTNVPGAQNPLFLDAVAGCLLLFCDEKNKENAEAHMLTFLENVPDTCGELAKMCLQDAKGCIGGNFCEEVAALLAASYMGLRESDIEAIFKRQNKTFSAFNFTVFSRYMQVFLSLKNNGCISFCHREIHTLFVKELCEKQHHTLLLDRLSQLDNQDEVKTAEAVWQAFRADDKRFLAEYIQDIVIDKKHDAQEIIATQVYKLTFLDAVWVQALFAYAVQNKPAEHFLVFASTILSTRFDDSIEACKLAISLYSVLQKTCAKAPVNKNDISPIFYAKPADWHREAKEPEKALVFYQEALARAEIIKKNEKTPKAMQRLAVLYEKLGNLHRYLFEYDAALACLKSALATATTLVETEKSAQNTLLILRFYASIGDVYRETEAYESALAACQKGLYFAESLELERQTLEIWELMAQTYHQMGRFCETLENQPQALAFYRKQLRLEGCLSKERGLLRDLQNVSKTALSLAGRYEEQQDDKAALEMHLQCLLARECLAKNAPEPETLLNLIKSYRRVAGKYNARGDFNKALSYYKKSLTLCESLAKTKKTHKAYFELALCAKILAKLYAEMGNEEQTAVFLQKENEANCLRVDAQDL